MKECEPVDLADGYTVEVQRNSSTWEEEAFDSRYRVAVAIADGKVRNSEETIAARVVCRATGQAMYSIVRRVLKAVA